MGCRVHVIKKQRDYGTSEGFNYQIEEFENLLETLGCQICKQDGADNFFEVTLKEYKRALKVLAFFKTAKDADDFEMKVKKMCDKLDEGESVYWSIDYYDNIADSIENTEYDIDGLISLMNCYLNERDKHSEWVQFEMW